MDIKSTEHHSILWNNRAPSSIDRALDVLEAVVDSGQAISLAEASARVGLPRPTVHRILRILVGRRYLARRGRGMYGPGPRVLTLAGQISATLDYAAVASPELRRLQDMTPHTIHFGVLVDVEAVYVAKLEGTRPYQMRSTIGMRLPLHCTAIGKAILAYLPDLELAELLSASKLTRNTQRTITSPQLLRDELRSVKQSGYAIDDEENEEGIRCVAAPVFGADGHVVGAISVAAPTFDLALSDIASVAPHIIRAADGVSHRLGAVRDQGAGPEVIPARMSGRFPNQKEGSGDKKPTHP